MTLYIDQIAVGNRHTLARCIEVRCIEKKQYAMIYYNDDDQLGTGNNKISPNYIFFPTMQNKKLAKIKTGLSHDVFLFEDGSVHVLGNNSYGQLGLSNNKRPVYSPTRIFKDVIKIGTGNNHTVILHKDGSVWSTGNNEFGQLGLKDNKNRNQFCKVTGIPKVVDIAVGYNSTFIICEEGNIFAAGLNNHGQLGTGYNKNLRTFVLIPTRRNKKLAKIKPGLSHTVFLCKDGSVHGCGDNSYGQLGLSNNERSVYCPTLIFNDVIKIGTGDNHTVILRKDGSVWSTGNNEFGQLGLNNCKNQNKFCKVTEIPKAADIAVGYKMTFVIYKIETHQFGRIFLAGSNPYIHNSQKTFFQVKVKGLLFRLKEINEFQKHIIRITINYFLKAIIDEKNISSSQKVIILEMIISNKSFSDNFKKLLKEYDLWDTIKVFGEIFEHPCPQNRKVGDPTAASGKRDGIMNGECYYWQNGFGSKVLHEPQGILGLTAKSDLATVVTKRAVVDYIRSYVKTKTEEFKKKNIQPQNSSEAADNPNLIIYNKQFFDAFNKRNWKIMKSLLVKRGIDVNKTGQFGYTPLVAACQEGKVEIVELLLKNGKVNVNKADKFEDTPFRAACEKEKVEIVKLLLKNEKVDVNKPDKYGKTALRAAYEKGKFDIVELLLKNGKVDVNKPDI